VSHFDLRRPFLVRALAPLALLLSVACSDGDIGEECGEAGDTDECVDGAICTNEGDDEGEGAVCRALCEEHEDCADDERCNGVSQTNLKSCQPDE